MKTNVPLHTPEAFELIVKDALARGTFHSCVSCMHYNHKVETCFKWQMKPPAKVIVFSCGKDWEDDIPF